MIRLIDTIFQPQMEDTMLLDSEFIFCLSDKIILDISNSINNTRRPNEGCQDVLIQQTESHVTCAKCAKKIILNLLVGIANLFYKYAVHYDCIDNSCKKYPTCLLANYLEIPLDVAIFKFLKKYNTMIPKLSGPYCHGPSGYH
uniref:Uncharacterized protein n=1 Tax=Rhizophagus irregularis (strain DAOM 181602 / DAOM 197198 / MUCL 43194) TaxID=747089 RepID=U9U5L5_RHIID